MEGRPECPEARHTYAIYTCKLNDGRTCVLETGAASCPHYDEFLKELEAEDDGELVLEVGPSNFAGVFPNWRVDGRVSPHVALIWVRRTSVANVQWFRVLNFRLDWPPILWIGEFVIGGTGE